MRVLPKTHLGKWSIGLILAFFAVLLVFFFFVNLGEKGGATFFSDPKLAIPALLAGIFGVASFFVGLTGIMKEKECSLFVFISTIIGFFVLIFVLGEILFPH